MFKLPQKVINDIEKYKESLTKFLNGEIKDTFFRGIRVPWGFYSQRGGKVLMSRLRIPSGILTSEQLKAISIAAEKFADGKLHITTRQDIQIHNVIYENSIKIVEFLKDFNISSRGGGGNTVRNITGCYLSGICPYEKYEVYKVVWGLTEYLLTLDESYNLPRKFKIAFSGCEKDCAFSGVNDIGFIALNGRFKAIVGGGMGAKSAVGRVYKENVSIDEVGYIAKSVMNVFNKYGDRKNRHHNRLRFLIQDIGWERFIDLCDKELSRLKNEEYISLRLIDGLPPLLEIDSMKEYIPEQKLKFNLGKQKQKGYWYFIIRIPFGEVDSARLFKLSQLGDILPNLIFRTTQRQNIVISNIPQDKIDIVCDRIKNIFDDYLYPETIYDIVCCKAATTCNLGICNAIGLAPEILKELKKLNLQTDKLKDVRININGCPNACGQHPIGTISFSGLARKVYGKTVPFYKVYIGGKIDSGNTKLAEEIGIVPARAVPKFISEFVLNLQETLNIEHSTLSKLIQRYCYVPSYEEDKSYYIDFGKEEEFSLSGLSQGECGAGVIDMIESDLESAKQSLVKSKENSYDINETKLALVYSCRAFLIVKGIDPKNEQETVKYFIEKFVNSGICNPEFKNVDEVYQKIVSHNISNEEAYIYVEKLYNEVKKIYSSMDSNFNFPIRYSAQTSSTIDDKLSTDIYDLRGTPCPLNYVKAKLKLEEMNIGDILQIYLDDGDPIRNVPVSLRNDGHQILKVEQIENFYKVVVRKKV